MLFEMPKMEVLKFAVEDVITVSTEDPGFFDHPCV